MIPVLWKPWSIYSTLIQGALSVFSTLAENLITGVSLCVQSILGLWKLLSLTTLYTHRKIASLCEKSIPVPWHWKTFASVTCALTETGVPLCINSNLVSCKPFLSVYSTLNENGVSLCIIWNLVLSKLLSGVALLSLKRRSHVVHWIPVSQRLLVACHALYSHRKGDPI